MHMPRYSSVAMMNLYRNFFARQTPPTNYGMMNLTKLNPNPSCSMGNKACDVFINHRGIDTKRTIATLLYDHLSNLNIQSFLDNKNMKPGDKLFDNIDNAIKNCKIGITVFSPNYCKSYFCLHELALFMESKKKVIPIFCDIKPSELRISDIGNVPGEDLQRFKLAIEEAKHTVGLTFDSSNGYWSDVVRNATDIILESLIGTESEKQMVKSSNKTPMVL